MIQQTTTQPLTAVLNNSDTAASKKPDKTSAADQPRASTSTNTPRQASVVQTTQAVTFQGKSSDAGTTENTKPSPRFTAPARVDVTA